MAERATRTATADPYVDTSDAEAKHRALSMGARDFLTKAAGLGLVPGAEIIPGVGLPGSEIPGLSQILDKLRSARRKPVLL